MDFSGKVALVTGGSRGMGREVAICLGREGADVAINYASDAASAEEVVAQIKAMGRRAFAVQADIRDRAAVEAMAARTREELGTVSVLILSAGQLIVRDFLETSEEDWDLMWDIHMKGSFLVTQAVARQMREAGGGSIVIVTSSTADKVADPGIAAYASSKAGQTMYAKSLAFALAGENIRVNVVLPGSTRTDMIASWVEDPEVEKKLIEPIPMKRLGTVEDVAAACLFLASDQASFITGATVAVDGGYTLA
ncbi:MAG: glucose 1-dehydrogenase [Nitrospinota bacterium]|nr:glucose 1-dehydrogenase [Nitrospinota bacterium]MDP7371604.1 glucose 1-dehydrogenase [Nitrospinota bacterium]MDP7504822.1 glucose 1-dehydrogenase [Nitrospinota bacterium]MDP7661782.1 glucose 1-dehydrogenase [Nitrospinota bacterium]HJP14930.1 glucose 1-dehydrogenase [Nitrospinota bacterium]